MSIPLILIGGGGHCKSVIDVIESSTEFSIAGIIDTPEKIGSSILNYKVIGSDSDISLYIQKGYSFHITIGHIKSNTLRVNLFNQIKSLNGSLPVIKSSSAIISKYASVNEGSIIMHNVLINAGAHIGSNCIINSGAVIEHDVIIEENCHISTGSYINGECIISRNSFVGSNSTIVQCTKVAEANMIAAGSVILKNTEPSSLYAGNPAQLKKKL